MHASTSDIKVKRLTVSYGLPYENAIVLSRESEQRLNIPNLFEEDQISFTCKDGLFTIPEYKLIVVHLNTNTIVPAGSVWAHRITTEYELVYGNVHIIAPEYYDKLGIPLIYNTPKQFVFVSHEGTFIAHDQNIVQLHLSTTEKIKRK